MKKEAKSIDLCKVNVFLMLINVWFNAEHASLYAILFSALYNWRYSIFYI